MPELMKDQGLQEVQGIDPSDVRRVDHNVPEERESRVRPDVTRAGHSKNAAWPVNFAEFDEYEDIIDVSREGRTPVGGRGEFDIRQIVHNEGLPPPHRPIEDRSVFARRPRLVLPS
jgi:hypothetical protein